MIAWIPISRVLEELGSAGRKKGQIRHRPQGYLKSTSIEKDTRIEEKLLQRVRSTQPALSFEKVVPLGLSKFPAKTKTQWEQWLLNQKAVLVKK